MPAIVRSVRHDSKKTLWINVLALMERDYGGENLNRLAREAKVGLATATRLKNQGTSVGLDVLDKIAAAFRVSPCELLSPDMKSVPEMSPLAQEVVEMFDSMTDPAKQERAYGIIHRMCVKDKWPAFGASPPEPAPKPEPQKNGQSKTPHG
jgi:transcriptional regulator with XRE-family HTH domain